LVCNFWRCPALTSIRFIDGTYPIIRATAGLRLHRGSEAAKPTLATDGSGHSAAAHAFARYLEY
jgi:hypothetical protein